MQLSSSKVGTYKGIGGGADAAQQLLVGDRGRGWCSSAALWCQF